MVVRGAFDAAGLRLFAQRAGGGPAVPYGRAPVLGESVASFSGAYPARVMSRVAAGAAAAAAAACDVTAPQVHRPRPPPWLVEMVRSLDWAVVVAYDFKTPAHINVLEYTAYNSLAKYCAKRLDGHRIPVCLDSSVTVGSSAHGRSSSRAIARVQQKALPYVIGGGLYFSGLQTPRPF